MLLAFGKVKTLEKCRLNASANKARKPQNRLRIKGDGLKQRTQIVRTEIQANKTFWIKCLFWANGFFAFSLKDILLANFLFFRRGQNVFVFFLFLAFPGVIISVIATYQHAK